MKNKFRLRRWLFGENRRNYFVKFLAKQCQKNINHFNNEDRNHLRNGEFWLQKTLMEYFNLKGKLPIVFDVGANNGEWSLNLLKHNPETYIHCFEPSDKTFSILSNKLSSYSNVSINKVGLSNKNHCIDFFENDAPDVTSLYQRFNSTNKNKISVNLIKGDGYLTDNKIKNIDFLKIDIEGMEYDALVGLSKSLQNNSIQLIQFEYGEFNIHSEKMLKHFYLLLSNFKIGKLFPNHIEFEDWHHELENFKPANIIAINKKNTELIKLLNG